MSSLTETQHLEFLQGAWSAVLQDQPEPFEKSLLLDYVSSDVIGRLPEFTTLENVLLECRSQEAVQESYIKSFMALPKAWVRLTPESRHSIIQKIEKFGLQKSARLAPLEDDEAALTIRWDTANKLFAAAHDGVFKACAVLGLEMLQPRRLPQSDDFGAMLQHGQEALLGLLRERINIDKTAVTMAVGYVTPVSRTRIMHNLDTAFLDCLDSFRAALLHWAEFNPKALIPIMNVEDGHPSPEQLKNLRRRVEDSLGRFKREYEQLRASLEDMSTEPTISEKLRRFFETKSTTLH